MSKGAICGPDPAFLRKEINYCPVCERQTEQAVQYQAWYDPMVFCTRCGDAWAGAELLERPFAPRWREKAKAKHRRLWDEARHGPPPTLKEMDPGLFELLEINDN